MRSGAYDFIPKPFSPGASWSEVVRGRWKTRALVLKSVLRHRLEHRDLGVETMLIGRRRQMARGPPPGAGWRSAGRCADPWRDRHRQGKLVARCLHDHRPGAKGNFVALNCGGLPETLLDSELFGHEAGAFTGAPKRRIGKIEHANGGTLFLDEVETMPMAMQIKLLRVLQERTLERLGSNQPRQGRPAASSPPPGRPAALAPGRFRADLYYRLNVVTIDLPPCASGARTSRCSSSTS